MASGGHSSSWCTGLSLSRPLLLRSTGSRCTGSAIVAHGPSRSAACGTFPDQGSNPCSLHWQADSQPLRHQGSPQGFFLRKKCLPLIFRSFSFLLIIKVLNAIIFPSEHCFWSTCQLLLDLEKYLGLPKIYFIFSSDFFFDLWVI